MITDPTVIGERALARITQLKEIWAYTTEDDPDDYALSQDDWEVGLGEEDAAEIVALLALTDAEADQ